MSSARSGPFASRPIRSFPRMKVTSSPIRVISFLAEPRVNEGLSAYRCTCVEHISNRLLVKANKSNHDTLFRGEPADDTDGEVRVERMGNPPELMATGLPDPLEGSGFLNWLSWQIHESLQHGDCSDQESTTLLLDVREPAVELLRPVND